VCAESRNSEHDEAAHPVGSSSTLHTNPTALPMKGEFVQGQANWSQNQKIRGDIETHHLLHPFPPLMIATRMNARVTRT
jgi:hypothetical protein